MHQLTEADSLFTTLKDAEENNQRFPPVELARRLVGNLLVQEIIVKEVFKDTWFPSDDIHVFIDMRNTAENAQAHWDKSNNTLALFIDHQLMIVTVTSFSQNNLFGKLAEYGWKEEFPGMPDLSEFQFRTLLNLILLGGERPQSINTGSVDTLMRRASSWAVEQWRKGTLPLEIKTLLEKIIKDQRHHVDHEKIHMWIDQNEEKLGYSDKASQRYTIFTQHVNWVAKSVSQDTLAGASDFQESEELKKLTPIMTDVNLEKEKKYSAIEEVRRKKRKQLSALSQLKPIQDSLSSADNDVQSYEPDVTLEECRMDYFINSYRSGIEEILIRILETGSEQRTAEELITLLDEECFLARGYMFLEFPPREEVISRLRSGGRMEAAKYLMECIHYPKAKEYIEKLLQAE